MARTKRVLAGAAKDAFLRRMLASETGLDEETRARLMHRLQDAVALLAIRHQPYRDAEPAAPEAAPAAETPAAVAELPPEPAASCTTTAPAASAEPFDPYSPNVIVVFRTRGRDAVLAELQPIDDVDSLRLLAREQQLGIAADLADACDIRHAIVAAAERRIANRRAAAS